ncbi:MAG: bifunctional hydroxymethylpyrimidine kinase/phosphomethylpyrimidine kinase, partial [Succinivibrio sp.]
MDSKVKVLLIAGLDSGNGAGITADCMTVTDFNVWPLSCVSAVTVQSLKRIVDVESVSTKVFSDTLDVLSSDFENIKAVKVGLISDARQLDTVISFLGEKLPNVPVVWDPVLCGTAGDLNSCDIKSNLKKILPLVTIFTPNLIEAMELLDWDTDRVKKEGVEALADEFIKLGALNVIIKGGHNLLNTDATDTFKGSEFTFSMSHERIEGEGAHGGGCALSSAIAALLSLGYAPHDAAVVASAYVYSGIKNPAFLNDFYRPPIGHTRVIDDLKLMPFVREDGFPVSSEPFKKCPLKLGLYPVVDSYEWIERLTALGIKTIQLRIKDKERPTLYEEIEKSVELCRKRRVRLFIDDHYELAIKAKAYGVHLGM